MAFFRRSGAHAKPLNHDLGVVVEHRRILPPGEDLLGPEALVLAYGSPVFAAGGSPSTTVTDRRC